MGIGFVVTQRNYVEVADAINLARDMGASFIRFKPDIRYIHAIAWRNWKEAYSEIRNPKEKEGNFEIIITETGGSHHYVPVLDRCWSQYFYSTVGADNKIYPCDHLTSVHKTALGDCRQFKEEWGKGLKNNLIGRRQPQCMLCPPLSWRLNRLISQLYNLYKLGEVPWDKIIKWIPEAIGMNKSS